MEKVRHRVSPGWQVIGGGDWAEDRLVRHRPRHLFRRLDIYSSARFIRPCSCARTGPGVISAWATALREGSLCAVLGISAVEQDAIPVADAVA